MNAYAMAGAFLILATVALFFVMFPTELFAGWGDFAGFNDVYIPLLPLLVAIGAGFWTLTRRR